MPYLVAHVILIYTFQRCSMLQLTKLSYFFFPFRNKGLFSLHFRFSLPILEQICVFSVTSLELIGWNIFVRK